MENEIRESCVGCPDEGLYCHEVCRTAKKERKRIANLFKKEDSKNGNKHIRKRSFEG